MPKSPELIYWDSSVFLSYINGEEERIQTVDSILDDIEHSDGKKKIVTSAMAKTEVAFSQNEKTHKTLDDDTEEKINALWEDESVIAIIEVHPYISNLSRDLMRRSVLKGWKLTTVDAIHLASAQWVGAKEVHTFDSKLEKFSEFIGCKVCEPYVEQMLLPNVRK